MLENEKWMSNLKWFIGIVESRGADDPKHAGRIRVRCHGVHTQNKRELPTNALPWAIPLQSITSAATSGIGETPTGIIEGAQVLGVFLDEYFQMPIVLGAIGGVPTTAANPDSGFNDPNGVYPLENMLNQSDISKLADERAEMHPSLLLKREGRSTDIPIAQTFPIQFGEMEEAYDPELEDSPELVEDPWSEPQPRYGSENIRDNKGEKFNTEAASAYPMNHVRETESGHIFEVDDTPGTERIHTSHRSGTFQEIQHDGTKVTKVSGNNFDIHIKDNHVVTRGDCYITVAGNAYIKARNVIQEVEKDYRLSVGRDFIVKVGRNYGEEAGEEKSSFIKGNKTEIVNQNETKEVLGNQLDTVGGSRALKTGEDVTESITGDKIMIAKNYGLVTEENNDISVGGNSVTNVTGNIEKTGGEDETIEVQGNRKDTVSGSVTQEYKSLDRKVSGATKLDGGSLKHKGKNIGDDHKHKKVKPGPGKTGGPQ